MLQKNVNNYSKIINNSYNWSVWNTTNHLVSTTLGNGWVL